MPRLTKVLFLLSLVLLALSYPACQWGERVARSEMAKYSDDFVAAHQFDMIFGKWVLPGVMMFYSSLLLLFVALIVWLADYGRRWRNSKTSGTT
jgi:hypothetical protein